MSDSQRLAGVVVCGRVGLIESGGGELEVAGTYAPQEHLCWG
ncbi:hypothetical protein AABM36_08475 [Kocuria sp. KSNUG]